MPESHHGLLVERATDIYSFSHLTFHEYFTAKYISDHRIETKLIDTHLSDEKMAGGIPTNGGDDTPCR